MWKRERNILSKNLFYFFVVAGRFSSSSLIVRYYSKRNEYTYLEYSFQIYKLSGNLFKIYFEFKPCIKLLIYFKNMHWICISQSINNVIENWIFKFYLAYLTWISLSILFKYSLIVKFLKFY